jgi:hypothetical protein
MAETDQRTYTDPNWYTTYTEVYLHRFWYNTNTLQWRLTFGTIHPDDQETEEELLAVAEECIHFWCSED